MWTSRFGSLVNRAAAPRTASQPQTRRLDVSSVLAADEGGLATKVYHYSSMAVLGLTPCALALSPSSLNMPIDLALGFAFPLHGHIGMNYVLHDYVPKIIGKAAMGPARVVMFGVTIMTTAGLLRLNLFGPGITETLKTLWRRPEKK